MIPDIDDAVEALIRRGMPFRRIAATPWIAEVESRFGLSLPPAFRALVTRYVFPVVTLGEVELFANQGDGSSEDLGVAPFEDPALSAWLRSHDRLHVGRAASGSYDPACLALRGSGEPQLVSVDHEDVLLNRRTVRDRIVATSLVELLRRASNRVV